MTLSDTALITPLQVVNHDLGQTPKFNREVFVSVSGEYKDEGIQVIEAVSSRIRSYLGRSQEDDADLLAKQYTIYLDEQADWERVKRSPGDTDLRLRRRFVRAWPVLSVDETVTVDGRDIYSTESHDSLTFIAGYRRPDQALTDFPSAVQSAVASIDDIPLLPDDIIRCAQQLCVMRGQRQKEGLVGLPSQEREQGDWTVRVNRTADMANDEIRALRTIQHHRYIV